MRVARMVFVTAIAAASIGLTACGSSSDSSSDSGSDSGSSSASLKGKTAVFTIFEAGLKDEFAAAFLTPVEQRTGLKVTTDVPTDYTKLQTQVKSGNVSWTVVEADAWWALGHCGELLEHTDVTVPNLPSTYKLSGCDVPGNTWTHDITYDSKKFSSDPPKGWKDFFDTTKYPGKRAVWGSYAVNGLLEGALLADGVPADKLYPLDLDRAFKKLDTIRSSIAFYDTLAQATEMMQSRNVVMALATNNAGFQQAEAGGVFKPIWNQAILSYDSYIVPKGANMAAATAILKQIASAQGQKQLATDTTFGPTNPAVKVDLPAERVDWSPEGHESQTVPLNQEYYGEHYDEINERYTAWVSG